MSYKDLDKRKEYQRNYREKNKEKAKRYRAAWRAVNLEKDREYNRKWRKNNLERARAKDRNRERDPDKTREKNWKWKGIALTVQEYDAMLKAQNGLCAICQKHQNEFRIHFAVDHDHKTGEVRKLLCFPCNSGLGKFNDDLELLKKAVVYLRSF